MDLEEWERVRAQQTHIPVGHNQAIGLTPIASTEASLDERNSLAGTTALITGATAGIGAACARRFASHGARLVLVGRRAHRLGPLQHELGKLVPVHTIELDIRDRSAVQQRIADLPAEFARLDVLVNNAGVALGLDPAQCGDLDDWMTTVETNIMGLLYCTHAVLPGMVSRKKGHIINMGSVAGSYPYPGGNVYCGTKAFIHQFSLALRADLLGTKVRVTCIEPGKVQSELAHVRFKGDAAKAAAVYADTDPMIPDDIAEVIHWCVTRPAHTNINSIELMPVDQAFNPLAVHRVRK
ncbi:SDR family NAD(P)-dependent oxidoreductase [Bradyrhizobium sp. STM 3557]|uniref:SDR family NAD(P)-dependent oxidoreductase n=1 Tax=Bradyrhizobium sp. STM 3557 TaxID=578920 RepID=UPI00388FDC72